MRIQELQRINNSGIPYTHQTARLTKKFATPYIKRTVKLTNDLATPCTHLTVRLTKDLVIQHTHLTAKLTKISEILHIHLMVQPTKNLVIPYTKIADNYYFIAPIIEDAISASVCLQLLRKFIQLNNESLLAVDDV